MTVGATQAAYRVVAFGQDGKAVAQYFLYGKKLAKMQLSILLSEQKYQTCKVVLYDPEGKAVYCRNPKD
jgi:hypothetical protein